MDLKFYQGTKPCILLQMSSVVPRVVHFIFYISILNTFAIIFDTCNCNKKNMLIRASSKEKREKSEFA
jgi:hypothetical protein